MLGSSIEHPASRSAARRWADIAGRTYVNVPHDDATGRVTAADYTRWMTPDVAVATILHASPVTGIGMDVAAISAAIRAVAPDCLIIVDGIQHAAHGQMDLDAYDVDGYAISPYKMFSRHGFGIAWISDRLSALPHDMLINAPATGWELGTRDTGAYATLSDVVDYFDWLGGEVSTETDPRARIEAAGRAINSYETHLTDAMINGTGNLPGLREMEHVTILAGADNPAREGLVSIMVEGKPSSEVVTRLNNQGIRTHTRKADHYSGNVLVPLGLSDCIRISLCHYNTEQEVAQLLAALREIGKDGWGRRVRSDLVVDGSMGRRKGGGAFPGGFMRYARQEDLQKLALLMQGSAEGISLADVEREFDVSRRTAERMRDAVRNAYPQIEELSAEGGRKYWPFPPGSLGRMVEPTLDELTAGHRAAAIARREGDEVTADVLERLLSKVQAMFREGRRRIMAADLEAQLMADGVAFGPDRARRLLLTSFPRCARRSSQG